MAQRNRDTAHKRTEDRNTKNAKDQAVARDPDIGGITQRTSYDAQAPGRGDKER